MLFQCFNLSQYLSSSLYFFVNHKFTHFLFNNCKTIKDPLRFFKNFKNVKTINDPLRFSQSHNLSMHAVWISKSARILIILEEVLDVASVPLEPGRVQADRLHRLRHVPLAPRHRVVREVLLNLHRKILIQNQKIFV